VNIVMLQSGKSRHRLRQAGRGHAPGPNRRADQMHRLRAARKPMAKHKAVQRAKNQALGPARSARDGADVLRLEPMAPDMAQSRWPGMNTQRP